MAQDQSENMNTYDCHFKVTIRQKSIDGVDLDEHRMDEMARTIAGKILEEYGQVGVFAIGFVKVI